MTGGGGNVLGGNVLGGKCPGGKCPGGGEVLSPSSRYIILLL